jgi:hypothetical protein
MSVFSAKGFNMDNSIELTFAYQVGDCRQAAAAMNC